MSVRSALMRVRWNDIPVRRFDSSVEISSGMASAGVTEVASSEACAVLEPRPLVTKPDPSSLDRTAHGICVRAGRTTRIAVETAGMLDQ